MPPEMGWARRLARLRAYVLFAFLNASILPISSSRYKTGVTRSTTFTWTDATKTMTWAVTGTYAGPNVYLQADVVYFSATGVASLTGKLGTAGTVAFK